MFIKQPGSYKILHSGIQLTMDFFISSGLSGLFLSSFFAATVIPLSSEGVLSYLIYNDFNMCACLLVASIGNTLGGITSYYLGRAGKLEWLKKRMNISLEKIHKTQHLINKYRSLLAFFCWLPGVGDVLAVSLGYFRCRAGQVIILMFAGKAFRYVIWACFTVWSINAVQ